MSTTQTWYVKNWGMLGWIETALKLLAVIAALVMFFSTNMGAPLTIGGHPRLFSMMVLSLLTLATVAQLNLRLKLKEIIAMAFAVAFFIGHVSLLIAMLRAPTVTNYPLVFGGLILVADLVKLRFLVKTQYSEAGVQTSGLLKLIGVVMGLYGLFVVGLIV